MMRKTNLKSENINGKLITFTKEQSYIHRKGGYGDWTVPTVRAYYKGKEIGHTSYSNPKAYMVQWVRKMIKRGEI